MLGLLRVILPLFDIPQAFDEKGLGFVVHGWLRRRIRRGQVGRLSDRMAYNKGRRLRKDTHDGE